MCESVTIDFGPIERAHPYEFDLRAGSLLAMQVEGKEVEILVDYRTQMGGVMDATALRAVREAVAESPAEFLASLDKVIALLGEVVPPARTPRCRA